MRTYFRTLEDDVDILVNFYLTVAADHPCGFY